MGELDDSGFSIGRRNLLFKGNPGRHSIRQTNFPRNPVEILCGQQISGAGGGGNSADAAGKNPGEEDGGAYPFAERAK